MNISYEERLEIHILVKLDFYGVTQTVFFYNDTTSHTNSIVNTLPESEIRVK